MAISTVSFSNTPQAKDDSFIRSEDVLLGDIQYLAVMANDLGGAAKSLYSVDDGTENDNVSGNDLLVKDLAGAGWQGDVSALGAKIWIAADGRVAYDATGLGLDALADGNTLSDSFTYAIRLGNGTLSWATATVTITGTNDGPVAVADTATVKEDTSPNPVTGNVLANDTDVDVGDTHSVTAVNGAAGNVGMNVAGTYGTLHLNSDGSYTYTLNNALPSVQALAEGATITEVFSYTNTDNHGASSNANLTITVTGTNDAPTVSNVATAADEDGAAVTASFSGDDVDSDDDGTSLTYTILTQPGEGSVTNNGDGTFTFDPGSDFQDLAEGQTRDVTFTYKATDSHNADSTSGTVTVTVTGTNDAPTVSNVATAADEDGTAVTASFSGDDVDSDDDGTSLTYTILTQPGEGSVTNNGDGTFTFDPGSDFQDLAEGQTRDVTFTYKATDSHNADSTSGTVTVTVTGTNDAPIAVNDTGSATEKGGTNNGSGGADASGNVLSNDTDVDTLSTSFAVTAIRTGAVEGSGMSGTLGSGLVGAHGTLTLNANGTYTYAVNETDAAVQALNAGGILTDTFNYTMSDGSLSDTAVLTVTINGANDAPLAVADTGDANEAGVLPGSNATGNVLTNDSDVDTPHASLVVSQVAGVGANVGTSVAGVYGSVTINADGSYTYVVDNANPTVNALNAGGTLTDSFGYQVSDGAGGFATTTLTVTIHGTNDASVAPVVDLNGPLGAGNDATASYTTAPVTIAPSGTITDVDSANLMSLTVTLTNPKDNSSGTGGVREVLSLNAAASGAATTAGLTVTFPTNVANATDPVTLSITGSASVATYQTILEGILYADTKPGAHDTTPRVVTIVANDGTANSVSHTVMISVAKPAGVAGEEINLALHDPTADASDLITFKVTGVPAGWTLNAGTLNADGSWTVSTSDPSALTVKSPSDYTGAVVLNVVASWTNADGSTGRMLVYDNVEVFAQGAPIFALSAEDHLTGSSGSDLFVFGQPISGDTLHNFDAVADKIDLIGFDGIGGFGDLAIADDGAGNAVVTLGANQTITILGVSAASLGADNFVFNVEPVMDNAGTMTIADGAIMPLGGTINNTGTIALGAAGAGTELEVIVNGVTLQGGGHLTLSDDDNNLIFGGASDALLSNIDNIISGAGQIGGGQMTLANAGTILADGTHALVIDTGANTVTNAGLLESTGSGGLVVDSNLANDGHIWANGGNVTIRGDVTGSGDATISGTARLDLDAGSHLDVLFADDNAQTLELDAADLFSGTVTGFGAGDVLDFADLGLGTTLDFAANADGTGGTLTLTDGAHAVAVNLAGNYQAGGFTASCQQGAGVLVTYDEAHIA